MKSKKIIAITLSAVLCSTFAFQQNSIIANAEDTTSVETSEVPPAMPDGEAPEGNGGFNVSSGESVERTAVQVVDGTSETISNQKIVATEANESTIKVTNGGSVEVSNASLIKESGEMTVEEASDFFGANAGFLAEDGSTALIQYTNIETNATGGNAVFCTGEGSKIQLKNLSIKTTKDHSRGLDATYQGEIDAENISISTEGAHSAAVATDRGEGTITVKDSSLNTAGEGSPCIYSTGDISAEGSNGTATGSSIAVIEGKNSIDLNNCSFTGYAIGRGTGGVDDTGIMIYQSMSGDADSGVGSFSATDSNLTISSLSSKYETAPMFFITNTDAVIDLTNTNLNFGSGILVNVAGNSGEWGTEGSNGGNLTLNATDQTLNGDITVDDISTIDINLTNSKLISTVNADNIGKEVNVTLDENSTWNVTGTSYISSLTDADESLDNIYDNGNTIYYDASNSSNSWLNGQTIELRDGGMLTPQ